MTCVYLAAEWFSSAACFVSLAGLNRPCKTDIRAFSSAEVHSRAAYAAMLAKEHLKQAALLIMLLLNEVLSKIPPAQ